MGKGYMWQPKPTKPKGKKLRGTNRKPKLSGVWDECAKRKSHSVQLLRILLRCRISDGGG